MALTGTPLINDIEDFRAIWQFLGWIDDKKPRARADGGARGDRPDPGRPRVLSRRAPQRDRPRHRASAQGRRRRRHPGPTRSPTSRSSSTTRSAARSGQAEQELARRLVARYERALAARTSGVVVEGIDHDLVRRVADVERKDTGTDKTGDNVFTMMRRIGQAKAGLAADYAAQLARNVGKVVFFAKHIDVMDAAEQTFAKRGIGYASIRGDQTPEGAQGQHRRVPQRPRRRRRGLLPHRGRGGAQPAGRLQRRARRAVVDHGGADAGDRPGAPHRADRAGHRLADHRRPDDRPEDRASSSTSKAGLAARALDGSDEEVGSSADVQLEALVSLLTDALDADAGVAADRVQ